MYFPKRAVLAALSMALMLQQGTSQAADYVDVLDVPARQSELAIKSWLVDVAAAGNRMVAVGQRGHILYSDDAGKTWRQASVPVSSDLTAVYFPTPTQGWAVGHDGVVLHSSDTGATWTKQLDGKQTGKLMVDYFSKQLAALPAPEPAAEAEVAEDDYSEKPLTEYDRVNMLLDDAKRMEAEGADKPFLDVWFENDKVGFVVGAFNMIFRTEDGGQSWTPINALTDNPQGYHLNAIAVSGNDVFIVGEQGMVLKLDRSTQRFVALPTPYQGSYFGVVAKPGLVIIHGLRGHAFRSVDGGKNWINIETGTQLAITAATIDEAGHIFLFSQAGHVLISTDGGVTFRPRPQSSLSAIAGAAASNSDSLVLVGGRGVRVFPIE